MGDFEDPKKNLMEAFEEDANMMRVFLRIKPISDNNLSCIKMESDTSICAKPPKDSNTYKNKIQGSMMDHQFTFTRVLKPQVSQQEVFDQTMKDILEEFLDGKNNLIFAYGATGAGKTHTIQGNLSDPGIMIRSLDVLFNALDTKLTRRGNVKPCMGHAILLNEKAEEDERAIKESIMKMSNSSEFEATYLSEMSCLSTGNKISGGSANSTQVSSNEMTSVLSSKLPEGDVFSAWVSFAEVYNEAVYDLLDPKLHKRPTQLKVMTGAEGTGDVYIKGLHEVQVCSAEEAYKALLIGKGNLKVASTKLNHVSSRSHSIFTVKLVKVPNVDDPSYAYVNRLCFCDLAGSERTGKAALGESSRIKEAGNINTSLMVLGRCIEALKHNQKYPHDKKPVPVRDSKLTRIFQGFFLGIGRASMITNISQAPDQFDETLHVLKFSSLAQQVVSQDLRRSRLSTAFLQPVESSDEEYSDVADGESSSVVDMLGRNPTPKQLLTVILNLEKLLVRTVSELHAAENRTKDEVRKRETEVKDKLIAKYQVEREKYVEENTRRIREMYGMRAYYEQDFVQFMEKFGKAMTGDNAEPKKDKTRVLDTEPCEIPKGIDASCQVTPQNIVVARKSSRGNRSVPVVAMRETRDVAVGTLQQFADFANQVKPETRDVAIQVELETVEKMKTNGFGVDQENIPVDMGTRPKRPTKKPRNFSDSPDVRSKPQAGRKWQSKAKKFEDLESEDEKPTAKPLLRRLRVRKPQI